MDVYGKAEGDGVISFDATVGRMSVPEFQVDEFRHHIEDFDISEDQKTEILKALWAVAVAFVDLNFQTDPERPIIPAVAEFLVQSALVADFSGKAESAQVKERSTIQQFNEAAKERGVEDK